MPPPKVETSDPQKLLRQLPQVEKLLRLPAVEELVKSGSRFEVTEALRAILASARLHVLEAKLDEKGLGEQVSEEGIVQELRRRLSERSLSAYRRVVNATGVILHTGLGRAVLPQAALSSLADAAAGYSLVEVDLESGERNQREAAVIEILRRLTGAESGTVVNNNAAATLLILASLARSKEVIISRGQLVEIGGSFRIPDILEESGARLVEVGTTNRTYLDDYRRAVGPETGMLLQVHTSNYEIAGFVHHTPLEELVLLGREKSLPVVSDLGSGCFVDLSPYGFKPEPLVVDRVRAGADLVCFSGDKLLGGPQSGIIVGRVDCVRKVRAHPLFRALRVDKVTLVLLEATLRAYADPEKLKDHIPVLRAIMEPADSVRGRALQCLEKLKGLGKSFALEVVSSAAQAGSGALPAQEIPSFALALSHLALSADEVARRLRAGSPPVFSRIHDGRVLLDFRTVLEGEDNAIVAAVEKLG